MLEHREGRWFWKEIGGKSDVAQIQRSGKMRKWEVRMPDGQEGKMLKLRYEDALKKLGEVVRGT